MSISRYSGGGSSDLGRVAGGLALQYGPQIAEAAWNAGVKYGPSIYKGGKRLWEGASEMYGRYNNYKRQRTYGPRFNNPRLGTFRGRMVRRFNPRGAPMRQGGFRPIPSRATMGLNRPAGLAEKKFLDVSTTVNADDVGQVIALNAMAQGTSQSTRVGNKISMTSIQMRLASANGATTTTPPIIRYMIIYDKQTNAAAPTIADILQAVGVLAPMNMGNRDRFVILMEDTWRPDNTYSDAAAVAEFTEYKQRYKRLHLDTIYNNTNGGTVADINSGGLFFIALSNIANGTAEPTMSLYARLRYTDC